MHYLQKQLLEEEKKRAKLNAGHCKTESNSQNMGINEQKVSTFVVELDAWYNVKRYANFLKEYGIVKSEKDYTIQRRKVTFKYKPVRGVSFKHIELLGIVLKNVGGKFRRIDATPEIEKTAREAHKKAKFKRDIADEDRRPIEIPKNFFDVDYEKIRRDHEDAVRRKRDESTLRERTFQISEGYELNERLDVGGILSSWNNIIGIINQVMETINSGLPQHSEFNAMASMVDYDGDGEVTFNDLTIALGLWGQGIMPATAQQYQAGQLMYDDSGLGDGNLDQGTRPPRPTPRPLPQRFPKPAIGQIPEGYELNEQKGQKFNFARARKVFEKHWREMERKVVNDLVQPYEGRGPVNYDLKAERQVSDYFETNTEDLLDYITERFEDLNSGMNESLGGFSGVGDEIKKLSRKLKYQKDIRRAINKRRPTLDTPYPYAGYPIDPYQFGGMRGPNRSTEDDRP